MLLISQRPEAFKRLLGPRPIKFSVHVLFSFASTTFEESRISLKPQALQAAAKRHEWSWESPIVSIEASQGADRKPQLISGLQKGADSTHLDDSDPMRPRWVLEVRNRRRSSRLVFTPLDVRGVEFTLRLPSAKSRLDNEE